MRRVYWYCIIFLAVSVIFPLTPHILFHVISIFSPATPLAAEVEKRDNTAALSGAAGAESIVTIDPGMIYVGDDGGVGLLYSKQFTLRTIASKNILSLQVAGVVAVINGRDSEDYHHGFYADKLFINGNYIDNLNNYCYQEEDEQFRTILVPLPARVLCPGLNKLSITATGPKDGNHDDFALREIKLLQW